MTYVFVFLGEFGYELFNWQGRVRKFKTVCNPDDKIVIGGRNGMDIWYPYADAFIDISEEPLYKASRADMYFAYDINRYIRAESLDEIRAAVRAFIEEQLKNFDFYRAEGNRAEFIFSSDFNMLDDIHFGPRWEYVSIYDGEGYLQNLYAKIDYDSPAERQSLEEKLQMSLSAPYVLIQGRKRDIVIRSKHTVPIEALAAKLAEKINVVILNFDTGRAWDSRSEIADVKNCRVLKTASAHEQAILIKYAAECIFPTENDFGSHIYVPPFMGKDVLAIAAADIYQLKTTPIKFWNDEIFNLGGKIFPFVAEEIFASERSLDIFCNIVFKRIAANKFFAEAEKRGAQSKLMRRIIVSDSEIVEKMLRSQMLINFIEKLVLSDRISPCFVLADILGGDAIIGRKLKEKFPQAEIIVQDRCKGQFITHRPATESGVKLYGGRLQHLIEENLPNEKLDIVMLLNTFCDWQTAQFNPHEQDIPMQTLQWLENNGKYFIVTATEAQINFLEERGLAIMFLGKCEDDLYMICCTKNF